MSALALASGICFLVVATANGEPWEVGAVSTNDLDARIVKRSIKEALEHAQKIADLFEKVNNDIITKFSEFSLEQLVKEIEAVKPQLRVIMLGFSLLRNFTPAEKTPEFEQLKSFVAKVDFPFDKVSQYLKEATAAIIASPALYKYFNEREFFTGDGYYDHGFFNALRTHYKTLPGPSFLRRLSDTCMTSCDLQKVRMLEWLEGFLVSESHQYPQYRFLDSMAEAMRDDPQQHKEMLKAVLCDTLLATMIEHVCLGAQQVHEDSSRDYLFSKSGEENVCCPTDCVPFALVFIYLMRLEKKIKAITQKLLESSKSIAPD